MRINEKSLRKIEHQLGQDGVWVSPSLRSTFPSHAEQRIEKAVDQARTKVYVVLIEVPSGHPQFHGRVKDLLAAVRDDIGRRATYVGIEGGNRPQVAAYSFGGGRDAFYASQAARLRDPGKSIEQVVGTVELVGNGNAEKAYRNLSNADRPDRDQLDGADSGREVSAGLVGPHRAGAGTDGPGPGPLSGSAPHDGGGPGVAIGIGVLIVIALIATGIGLVLQRGWGGRSRLRVPPTFLSTVRPAESDRHEKLARHRVVDLGERLDAADAATIDESSDAWQQALDHYDAARRILGGKHAPADTVGAIVIAARGCAAVDAAAAGTDWEPERPCYLNPLHGVSDRSVTWRGASAGVALPACTECAAAIDGGRMPDDVLDFVHDGRPRHYFALDLEPWSSTGYGSLDPDLLPRLGKTRLRIR